MIFFRRIVNGPPCEMRPEDNSVFRVGNDNNIPVLEDENGLVDWMCHFSRAQKMSASTEVLFQNWINYFRDIGISVFSYYHICPESEGQPKRNSIMAHYGLPKALENSHLMQGFYEDSTLMSYVFERNELLKFSDLQDFKGRTSREKKYFDAFRQLNLSEGYALPIFNSGLCHGFFVLGLGTGSAPFNKRQLAMVTWACQMGHYKYVDLMVKEETQATQLGASAKINRQKRAQLSDKQAAQKVILELKDGNIADHAQSKNDSYLYQIAAARKLGYEEPFSKPQSELNYVLIKMTASKDVTEDAWKLYHMLRQMKES